MKVIKSDSPFGVYQKIFKHVQAHHSVMVVWQCVPETGERKVSETRLNSIQLDSGVLHFDLPQDNPLVSQLVVYCYCEEEQFIFKTDIQNIKSNVLSIILPKEIQMLEEEDITIIRSSCGVNLSSFWKSKRLSVDGQQSTDSIQIKSMNERTTRDQEFLNNEFDSLSLDEEDKLFADKRESPRARPKIDKWIKIKSDSLEDSIFFKLFDLSRGGLSFITVDSHLFPKGSKIHVMGFEEFDLDDPLIGQVMSQRPIDDTKVEFKIGIKFDEGQD
jgi:hypothetical protein